LSHGVKDLESVVDSPQTNSRESGPLLHLIGKGEVRWEGDVSTTYAIEGFYIPYQDAA
jgi:hypothetical protein